jgi:hypothetical protein
MGWEQRNGKRYYYRKTRQGRRVISDYVGTGEIASLLFAIDQDEYNEKMWERAKWKSQKDDFAQIEGQSQSSNLLIRGLVRAHFLLGGYHPHKGQIRKKRNDR